jgi:hypothetical protein
MSHLMFFEGSPGKFAGISLSLRFAIAKIFPG